MQYQQNFLPGSGSTGAGSGLTNPKKNIISPIPRIGIPKPDTPMGTYKSVTIKKAPKTASIPPDTTRPRCICASEFYMHKDFARAFDVRIMRRISELTIEQSMQAATLTHSNHQYRQHFFPACDTVEQLAHALATPNQEWRVTALATAELTACVSSLTRAKVPLLRISAGEENHVLIRLLSKLGFVVDIKYSIMVRR